MPFNPNAVFISPSSLGDFDKCPQLYFYKNVFRTPRGLKIQIINPSLALGQTMHDAIDQLLQLAPEERSKEKLLSIFEFNWKNLSGEKGGFTGPEEETDYKNRGLVMLDRFWANDHFKKAVKQKIPDFPKVELGNDIILTGKLDWIEEDGQGYHVIDFKTGKNEEREDSKQLSIYTVLAGKMLNSDKIKTSYWYLDHEDNLTEIPGTDMEQTIVELTQKGEIIKLARQTNSFRCKSGGESCWACKDVVAVANGKGKLVTIDPARKQEIYILVKENDSSSIPVPEDLPF